MKKTWHHQLQITILILSGLFLAVYAYFYPNQDQLIGVDPKYSGKNVESLPSAYFDEVKKSLQTPVAWSTESVKHRLFLSDSFLYFPDRNAVEKEGDDTKVGAFPLGWLRKYDLPILDPTVGTQDPDGDGFTNIMEFFPENPAKGTNPIDPQSHPEFVTKLRLKELRTSKMDFKFTTVQQLDGQDVYSIILETEEGRRSFMKKKGDKLEGFEILNFISKKETQKNQATGVEEAVDVSELEVENTDLEIKTSFVLGKVKSVPEINATFVLALVDQVQQPIKVSRGKIFDIRGDKFKLLDGVSTSAKIKSVATNQEISVPQLTVEDFRLLPSPAKEVKK